MITSKAGWLEKAVAVKNLNWLFGERLETEGVVRSKLKWASFARCITAINDKAIKSARVNTNMSFLWVNFCAP